MRFLATYLVLGSILFGYLRGAKTLMPETFSLTRGQIVWSSIVWPYSLGLMVAGWDLAGIREKKEEEPEVETEEEFELPSVDVRPSKVLVV